VESGFPSESARQCKKARAVFISRQRETALAGASVTAAEDAAGRSRPGITAFRNGRQA
jgi:hypothetical protein